MYIYERIEKYSYLMVSDYKVTSWYLIRNAVIGALKRFGISRMFNDMQLYSDIMRKKAVIVERKVDLDLLQNDYKKFIRKVTYSP